MPELTTKRVRGPYPPVQSATHLDMAHTIRACREMRGMKQSTLGRRAGVSRAYISRIELGRANIRVELLTRIATVLGMTCQVEFVADIATPTEVDDE